MSRRLLLLTCFVLGLLSATSAFGQDRSAMWNAAKRVKFGLDPSSPSLPIVSGESATMNPNSPPNTPDVQVFNPSNFWQSENSIGVNFSNSSQLMVSTNGQIPGSNPVVQQTWAFSTDGGVTWPSALQSESIPPGILDCFGDPVAYFDRTGRAYFSTLGSPGGIYFVSTTDFGATWSARSDADNLHSSNDDKQHAAADFSGTFPNNVYTAWTDFGVGTAPIQFARSTNQGATWETRQQLAIGSDRGQGNHIAIGPNGEVYVIWADYTSGTAEVGIGYAKSTDGGATFNTPSVAFPINGIRISNGGIPVLNNARAASFPYADADRSNGPHRGWVYVVTPELDVANTGQADIYLHRSTNGGTTWSSSIRINGPDVQVGKWQFMPSIAVDPTTGGISVSYYSMDSTGSNFMVNRYMAYSVDGGDTWDNFVISDVRALWAPQLTPNTNTTYNGDYYETAATDGKAWPIWTDRRGGAAGTFNRAYVQRVIYSENFGFVEGTVTALGGSTPVSGASIDFVEPVLQQGASTDPTGFYFAGAKVDTPGTTANLTLRARKFGYVDTTIAVTLTRGDTLTRNFQMRTAPGGTLSVHSYTPSGNLRSFVQVKFGSLVVVSDSTNATTGLLSAPLPTGTYSVVVDAPSPYATKTFPSVVINAGLTTNVDALTHAVVENSPAAMRDTLAVSQVHAKTLTLTNTTTDPVPYRITDDNALARIKVRKVGPQPRAVPIMPVQAPKGAADTKHGQNPKLNPLGHGGPDNFGYQWIDSDDPGGPTYNWVDVRGVGTQITGLADDTNLGPFNIGFSFPFYGNNYPSFRLCSNGWVSFTSTSTAYSNVAIPDAAEPNNALYPFWDDMNFTVSGTAYYYYDAANTRTIIQYDSVSHYGGGGVYSYEIILLPNGTITYQYRSMVGTLNSATIGIENADGSDALQVVSNADYVHDNLAIKTFLPDAPWLSENPFAGTLAPNGTQDITVTFDATGLTAGTTYSANIFVDPTHPDVSSPIAVPASLTVQTASGPLIILSKTNIIFPTTQIGAVRRDSLTVRNGGDAVLTLSSITSTAARYTVSPSSGSINPTDSVKVYVTYTPVLPAGTDTGHVVILSNDPLTPQSSVSLTGTSIGAPLWAQRDSLVESIGLGLVDSIQFYARNIGTASGNFNARAVMYSTVDANAKPIVIPMTLRAQGKVANDAKSLKGNTPASLSAADGFTSHQNWNGSTAKIANSTTVGDVISSFVAPASIILPWGMGWNGTDSYLLVSDPAGPPIQDYHVTSTGSIITAVATPWMGTWPGDADYSGGFFYQVNVGGDNGIYKLNPDGSVVGHIVDPGAVWSGTSQRGLAYDPVENVFYVGGWNSNIVFKVQGFGSASPGAVISQFPFVGVSGLAFHSGTRHLWIASNTATSMIAEVDPTTGSIFQQFPIPGTPGFTGAGLEINSDGNLWTVNQTDRTVMLLDSGSPLSGSGNWLSIRPTTGTIAYGDSIQMSAKFDASDPAIIPGNYYGRIEAYWTNSPVPDTLKVEARMFVQPVVGTHLVVLPDTIDIGNVEIGITDSSKSVRIMNTGSQTLNVTGVSFVGSSGFSVSNSVFSLASLDTTRIKVKFTAAAPGGVRTARLNFVSNDPSAESVGLRAVSVGVPHVFARPDTFSYTLNIGPDTTRTNFKLFNTGTDSLHFNIDEALSAADRISIERSKTQQQVRSVAKGAIDPTPGQGIDAAGGPDAFGYRWIDSDEPGGPAFNWVDITSVGTPLTMGDDDNQGPFPLGFNFSFYGNSYNSLQVCSNGWVSFTSTSTAYPNTAIPAAAEPNNAIYQFWDDMNPTLGGTIHYYADAANSRFIVQYTNIQHYGTTEPGVYTYEVIIKANGDIVTQYLDMQGTLNSSTIGIENADGTIALQTVFNAAYVHNNLAILFTRDAIPWMSVDRTTGTLAPGDSTSISLRLHPATISDGTYNGFQRITGNTPDVARVGVHLVAVGVDGITVTSPNGGETWVAGQTYPIAWSRTGAVDTVKLEYTTNGGTGWNIITGGVPAKIGIERVPKHNARPIPGSELDNLNGTYNWTIPTGIGSTSCLVRVTWKSNASVTDVSNNPFTISSTAPPETLWIPQTNPSGTSTLYSVKAVNNNVVWIGGTGGVVIRTTNGGSTWTSVGGGAIGTDDIYTLDAVDANTAFVSTSPSATNIFRTTNGGTTWTNVYTLAGGFIDGIRMVDATTGYAQGDPVTSKWVILKTTDGGASWARIATEPNQVGTEAGWNNSFVMVGANMWFGTNSSKVYRSTDLGATWSSAATTGISSYAVWFNDASSGVAGFETGFTNASSNGGTSWSAAANAGTAQVAGAAGTTGSEFWATGGTNVYYTLNRGTAWTSASPNGRTGSAALWAIGFAPVNGDIYGWAAGASGTVLRYHRTGTAVPGQQELPTVFALSQNYPNPFNPTTKIKFDLPEAATVSLKIYNVLGQEVASLANGTQPAGYFETTWEGRNNFGLTVSSGIYFYRFEATGVSGQTFTSLKKMVFLK